MEWDIKKGLGLHTQKVCILCSILIPLPINTHSTSTLNDFSFSSLSSPPHLISKCIHSFITCSDCLDVLNVYKSPSLMPIFAISCPNIQSQSSTHWVPSANTMLASDVPIAVLSLSQHTTSHIIWINEYESIWMSIWSK